jgi:hypothetical protein
LIRFYSPLAQEKLLVTSPRAINEILVHHSYKFGKPAFVRAAIVPIAGEGLGIAEGNVHKVSVYSRVYIYIYSSPSAWR